MQYFVREMAFDIFTMNLALNEELRYQAYKSHKCQLIQKTSQENRLTNAKKLQSTENHLIESGTICFFSDENKFLSGPGVQMLAYNQYDVLRAKKM